MKILYPVSSPVKSRQIFGRGILRSVPVYRADHSAADAAWWAAERAEEDAYSRDLERRAVEFARVNRLGRGGIL